MTERQQRIARLLRAGNDSGQIATMMHIAEDTVCREYRNIARRIGVKSGWGIKVRIAMRTAARP